jgi:hypothetical protein
MTTLGEFEEGEYEGECEVCQGPATRMCEECYTLLCEDCICPECDENERELCELCDDITTDFFHCNKCWRIVCHDCYSFEKNLCVDCASGERR